LGFANELLPIAGVCAAGGAGGGAAFAIAASAERMDAASGAPDLLGVGASTLGRLYQNIPLYAAGIGGGGGGGVPLGVVDPS
jgi:hypothetical protein